MKRYYFSRSAPPNPVVGRTLVSGVIEGESMEAAQASMDDVFRTRGLPDNHASFAWQDLDAVRDPLGGILAITIMDA